MEKKYIDPELVKLAKEQNVFDILQKDGIPMIKKSREYRLQSHDSLVISPEKGFYWFSQDIGSTNPIDFYMLVENMNFKDAVYKVLDVMNYDYSKSNIVIDTEENGAINNAKFMLPKRAENDKRAFAYLVKTRKLDGTLIKELMKKGLIYQDEKHANVVFLGKNYDGEVVSAFKRSSFTKGEIYKGDALGSHKDYRFRIENPESKVVNVFESEIDLLSYVTMQSKRERNENYISLGGVSMRALLQFLKHSDIEQINICTDNDDAGNAAAASIKEKLGDKYLITRELPIGKDFNEDLTNDAAYVRCRKEIFPFSEDVNEELEM